MATSPAPPLRIVYLEDDPGACELVEALLKADQLEHTLEWVEDESGFQAALQPHPPDLILADFNLPTMTGLRALELKQELCPTVPFIFVSGALGESVAIAALKQGATDFLLKDALARLPSTVRRALAEAQQLRERLAAEEKVRLLSQALEQSPVAVMILDPAGKVVFANARLCALAGRPEAALLGQEPAMLEPGEVAPHSLAEALTAVREGGSWQGQLALRRTDGSTVPIRTSLGPIIRPTGAAAQHLVLMEDITQWLQDQERQRRLEAQLFQAQKLESIGTLAGGIAHDFNNILTGILGYTDLSIDALPTDSPVRGDLHEVRAAAMRAKDLVVQMLTFARQGQSRPELIDLASTVNEALKLIRASMPATIEIERHLEPGAVLADPTQIHQVVLNLGTNAAHAMHGRAGRLSVSVAPASPPRPRAGHAAPAAPARLRLTISDTGDGMDESILQRIFDPFFTTKQPGEGTGLGLAIVQAIVVNHQGTIRVRSQPGAGTTFEIELPVAAATAPTAEGHESVPPGRGERILVLDDEPTVANFAAACLRRLNYIPSVFTDPTEALSAFRASPGRFDAILTDLTMPRLTGVDFTQTLRSSGHVLPVVIMSGYPSETMREKMASLTRARLMAKPFTSDELARALHHVLED